MNSWSEKNANHKQTTQRSNEPIWWALFSAGGVCFAVFIPAAVIFLGLLLPMGVIEVNYTQIQACFFSFWGLIFSGAFIILPAFHAAHRIRHGLHDLKIQQHGLIKVICYGLASLLSMLTLGIWLMGIIA